MEQEMGNKKESEYTRKEVGENDEQWTTWVIRPNPVKAICVGVLHLPPMTLTPSFLTPASQVPQLFSDRSENDQRRQKRQFDFKLKRYNAFNIKTVPLRSIPELDVHVCARTPSRETHSLPHSPARGEGSWKRWHSGAVSLVASGIGRHRI